MCANACESCQDAKRDIYEEEFLMADRGRNDADDEIIHIVCRGTKVEQSKRASSLSITRR